MTFRTEEENEGPKGGNGKARMGDCRLCHEHTTMLAIISERTEKITEATRHMEALSLNVEGIHETLQAIRSDNQVLMKGMNSRKNFIYVGLLFMVMSATFVILAESSAHHNIEMALKTSKASFEIGPVQPNPLDTVEKKTR